MLMTKQTYILILILVGILGVYAEKPTPQVVNWLEQWGKVNTTEQSKIITEIKKAGPTAIKDLTKSLSDISVEKRLYVIAILQQLDKAVSAPELLQIALHDQSSVVRSLAVKTISQQNPNAIAEFCKIARQDKDEFARAMAIEALGNLQAKDAHTIYIWVQANAFDPNHIVKALAAAQIDKLGLTALPTLLDLTAHQEEAIRNVAITRIVVMNEKAMPTLLESLKIKDPKVRKSVAVIFGFLPKQGEKVAQPLLDLAFKDNDRSVQETAEKSLIQLKASAIPTLRKGLKSKDSKLRLVSIRILSKMGKDAKPATDDIIAALKDPDPEVVAMAKKVYQSTTDVSSESATDIQKLINDLKSKSTPVRLAAVKQLGKLGPKAGTAIPTLGEMLPTLTAVSYRELRVAIFDTLQKIGEPAYPLLITILQKEQDNDTRYRAAEVLGGVASKNQNVAIELAKALPDRYYRVRTTVTKSLSEAKQPGTLSILMPMLQHKDSEVRKLAATILGAMGKHASKAKATLQTMSQKDPDFYVRTAATSAVKLIP